MKYSELVPGDVLVRKASSEDQARSELAYTTYMLVGLSNLTRGKKFVWMRVRSCAMEVYAVEFDDSTVDQPISELWAVLHRRPI